MRMILSVVLVLAVVWCGYWFVGSRVVTQGVDRAFAEARAQGYRAENGGLSILGFPNRFDLTVTAPDLADPVTGFGWTAPFVQVFALTWRPWHIIAAFAPEQRIMTPAGAFTLAAGKLQASLRARPRASLPLEQMTLVGTDLSLAAEDLSGWTVSAPELRFATRDVAGTGLTHEIGLDVTGLVPGPGLLPQTAGLPTVVDRIHLDADLTFSAPLDRFAPRTRPQVAALVLREALVIWGDLALHVQGRLAPDAAGLAEGNLTLRVTNWQRVLPVLVSLRLVKPEVVPTWTKMLAILAVQSGDPAVIDLTLTFAGGRVSLGPLPLGAAPRLR